MIEQNVKNLLAAIPQKNGYGEKITLVAAVKTQTPEDINRAINAGITDIGDNKVQEFKEKYEHITAVNRHFIGRLQTNKVKYLIGKVNLYHSVDSLRLAEEISKQSEKRGITSDILMEINIGEEQSKGGFTFDEASYAYGEIKKLPNVQINGLMAMLPFTDDKTLLKSLAKKMRSLYDGFKEKDTNFKYLSMGMSGDWELCVEAGSNMIRLGTAIFGKRNY